MWLWLSRLLAYCRRMWSSRRAERDLHDDVESYMALLADVLEAGGLPRTEAERQARVTLGGVEPVKESVRGIRAGAWLDQSWRDLHYACRGLARTPAFTITAVLTVALGIGVNTTVFSIVDSALFKPLPYERPYELVKFHRGPGISPPIRMSWAEVLEWRTAAALFEGVEVSTGGYSKDWLEGDRSVTISAFSPGLPKLLGVAPALGRVFTPDEADGNAPVVVIADVLWRQSFGGDPDVVGTTMTIGGRTFTVIGVMPPGFRYGPGGGGILEVWMPMPERPDPDIPASERVSPIFRLRRGLALDAAEAGAAVVAARMQADIPAERRWSPHLMPFTDARLTGLDEVTPGGRASMVMLLAAAGLVLIVACVSVAGLLLARGETRRQEVALRAALGASRGRLARLFLAEGVLVAGLGGTAAVVTARWTTAAIVALMPADMQLYMFTASEAVIDGRVLGFAVMAAGVVAMTSSVWPALSGSRVGLRASLGTGGQVAGPPPGRRRAGRMLLSAQVGLAFLLAVTAGLFSTSFARMLTEDLGYDTNGLGVIAFWLPEGRYETDDAKRAAISDLLARARLTPGVRRAAIGSSPAQRVPGNLFLPGDAEPRGALAMRTVGAGYFDTAGIRLIAGRDFSPDDRRGAPRVAIIDEAGARRVFGDVSPIGQQFRYHQAVPEATVIGVVETVAATDFVQGSDHLGAYYPEAQDYPYSRFLLRADEDLRTTLTRVRAALEAQEPGIRITAAGSALQAYSDAETFTRPRFYVVLVSAFALLAIASAAAGLYGLLAHAVGRRQREIGVRVALGSTPGRIRRLVLAEALVPVGAGLALGGLAAWWTLGLVGSLLYEIGPRDPWAFSSAAAALALATLLGLIAPIRRATGVDPIVALRAQ